MTAVPDRCVLHVSPTEHEDCPDRDAHTSRYSATLKVELILPIVIPNADALVTVAAAAKATCDPRPANVLAWAVDSAPAGTAALAMATVEMREALCLSASAPAGAGVAMIAEASSSPRPMSIAGSLLGCDLAVLLFCSPGP